MISIKQLKLADKGAQHQQQVIEELNAIARDIDRCEKTISSLKVELETVTAQHAGRRTTREDIAYLTALLDCAKKKLNWEKQLASVQKRTPALLERMTQVMSDPKAPLTEELRTQMLAALQSIQASMERLQSVQVS